MGLKYTKRAMTSYEVHRFFHGLEISFFPDTIFVIIRYRKVVLSIDHGCMQGLCYYAEFFYRIAKNMADKLQDYLTNLKMHDAKYQTTFIYSFTIRNF